MGTMRKRVLDYATEPNFVATRKEILTKMQTMRHRLDELQREALLEESTFLELTLLSVSLESTLSKMSQTEEEIKNFIYGCTERFRDYRSFYTELELFREAILEPAPVQPPSEAVQKKRARTAATTRNKHGKRRSASSSSTSNSDSFSSSDIDDFVLHFSDSDEVQANESADETDEEEREYEERERTQGLQLSLYEPRRTNSPEQEQQQPEPNVTIDALIPRESALNTIQSQMSHLSLSCVNGMLIESWQQPPRAVDMEKAREQEPRRQSLRSLYQKRLLQLDEHLTLYRRLAIVPTNEIDGLLHCWVMRLRAEDDHYEVSVRNQLLQETLEELAIQFGSLHTILSEERRNLDDYAMNLSAKFSECTHAHSQLAMSLRDAYFQASVREDSCAKPRLRGMYSFIKHVEK